MQRVAHLRNYCCELLWMNFIMGFFRKYVLPPLLWFFFSRFLKKLRILDSIETIQYLKNHPDVSLVRYGDGEFNLIDGLGPNYQQYSQELGNQLKFILQGNNEKLLIGIPVYLKELKRDQMVDFAYQFWDDYVHKKIWLFVKLLSSEKIYGNASVTRPWIDIQDRTFSKSVFDSIQCLWENRDVVVIEGEKTRFGFGNDLLQKANSIKRIVAPAKNAYEKYPQILEAALKQPKDSVFIIALGPTAKLLASALSRHHYRALDLGHLDIEYEWYVRDSKTKISIPNKYVNETEVNFVENCKFEKDKYEEQIICRIV